MSKIIPFDKNKDEENCDCPTCDLIEHFTDLLIESDIEDYRDIIMVAINQAKELGKIELLISEIESKKNYLTYLITGEVNDDDLN